MIEADKKIKLVIVEDQMLFREGLSSLLKNIAAFELLATFENGKAFAAALPSMKTQPNVALVDMSMPEMNGLELTEYLQSHAPEIKVIILTVYDQDRFVFKMIEAGVCGYLLKNCKIEEVEKAVKAAYEADYYFNEVFIKGLKSRAKQQNTGIKNFSNIPVALTNREKEILLLICKEQTNQEIGEQLNISNRTVDGHRNNLLAKTGSRNTAGLVLFAVVNNLLDLSLP